MNKTEMLNNVTRSLHRVGFKVKKYSPEILAVAGVVGAVTSAVMACKATTKINFVLEKTQDDISTIHEAFERGSIKTKNAQGETEHVSYTEEDHKKDLAIVYVKTGLEFVKLYGPAVLLGAASLGCLLTSNDILRKRNVALAAAYATVDKGFKDYRSRVIERFGEALDRELRYNIKTKEVEEIIVHEDGTEEKVTTTIDVVDPNSISEFARIYDDGNIGWDKNPEMNLCFLKQQQSYANDLLKTRGHVFLNEVYDMLGFKRTQAGNVVGWYYDEKNPVGDNFIDFGIYDIHDPQKRNFVNGHERNILLDFNVDGNILQYI